MRQYGEDFGRELFQRMKFCHDTAKYVSRSHNDAAFKKSVEYYNSKVKPKKIEEGELVLLKNHNF